MPSIEFSRNIPTLPSSDPAICPVGSKQPRELVQGTSLKHYSDGTMHDRTSMVVVEEPLHISLQDREEIILPRTPGDDAHLIAGHLFSLGLIRTHADILDMRMGHSGPDLVEVRLRHSSTRRPVAPMTDGPKIDPERIFEMRERFEQRQRLYHSTRATHAAALFAADGRLLAYGEDVSRHCAFDKAVGAVLETRLLQDVQIAMLTSRLASELAAKAATARIPVLCGFSAATSSGMELAETKGVTLIGRIGTDCFTVYANGWRLRA